jgi:hypothetical protein
MRPMPRLYCPGLLRPEMFPGIGDLPESTTESHVVNRVEIESLQANSTVMVPRNPAFRQNAPGIRGGVWGEAPRFFLFFLFFPVKIT